MSERYSVLVVDDEAEVVEALKRNLRNEAYDVQGTTSPREALALVEAGGIDLLICDIDMPEMDGLSLVSRVHRTRPDTIRILLTGDASLESAMFAINEGEVFRYITKPWSTVELRKVVRAAFARVDEHRRATRAAHDAASHAALLEAIEAIEPSLRRVVKEDGAYVIDAERVASLAASLVDTPLRELFDEELTRGPQRHEKTRRSGE